MKVTCVLIGHGSPPLDFPKAELSEYFRLHSQAEMGTLSENLRSRYEALDEQIAHWPRTPRNDPYKAGLEQLAKGIERKSGLPVLIAFNEFCAPTALEVVEQAVQKGAQKIIVVPTMLMRGGVHSERDIPAALKKAQTCFPQVEIVYAWPFDEEKLVKLFNDHVEQFAK